MSHAKRRIAVTTVGLLIASSVAVNAQPRRGFVAVPRVAPRIAPRVEVVPRFEVVPRVGVFHPYFYDPLWRPWYPWYGPPIVVESSADIRTDVTPKDAQVYVDGYYAGRASDFDGAFKRLHVMPGGHAVTLYLEGFRTVTEDVYVRPDSTFKIDMSMQRLPAGEASAPIPAPDQPALAAPQS